MKPAAPPPPFSVVVRKHQGRYIKNKIKDRGSGTFFFLLDLTAHTDVYVPLSVASGKKPTGLIYQIEGTSKGTLVTTDISVHGTKVTHVTLGTILYAKVPRTTLASFRVRIDIQGVKGKRYGIVINRINYKHNPSDARYQKLVVDIRSDLVKFE